MSRVRKTTTRGSGVSPQCLATTAQLIIGAGFGEDSEEVPKLLITPHGLIHEPDGSEPQFVGLAESVRIYKEIFGLVQPDTGSVSNGEGLEAWLDLVAAAVENSDKPRRIYGAGEAPPKTSDLVITSEQLAAACREERRAFPRREKK